MGDDIFGGGMNSGGLNPGMNSDLAKQMSLLSAAGRLRATSAGGQQQQPQRPMGMAPPVPPNVPDKQRAQFLGMMTQVLMHKNVALPPFITGQPNPAWNPEAGPLKHVQPATDNRLGALRLPGATPGRPGDIDLFKLWGAVTGAGGMQRISSAGQWENVAAHIGLQLPPALPGSHPPATQLAQLYYMLLSPLEEHMKQRTAQAKQAQAQAQMQALAAQQQQTPGQAHPQPLLTPAQMHQQQNPQANLGMQNPALGMQNPLGMQTMQNQLGMQNPMMQNNLGMQNMQPMIQNNMGMQNGLGMQTSLGMNAMNALNPVQMTPAQMHQQQQGQGAMLTPAQMHAMQNGTGAAAGAGGMTPAVNGMPGGVGGMAAPTAGPGGAMPPPAPVLPDPMGLGIASTKRKSEPDEDEKRAKLKVADPAVAAVTPTVPAAPSNRRHKIEYVPLRLDVETFGGRALDGMMANVGVQGSMERPMRDISELGIVDIPSLTLSLRARTPRSLGYALGTLSVLSTHSQQTFPLVRCEDLVDTLIELLEAAIWDGENWTGGKLGHSEEVKPPINEIPVKNETDESMQEDIPDDEVPIRTHRELVRIAAEQGAGMRIRGRGWDGGSIEQSMKHDGTSLDPDLAEMYGDIAPPGLIRSDVILTIVRLLRNFSMGAENCAFMAREGSRLVDVLAGMVGFREGPEDEDPIGFINGSWDGGVHVSITPLSSALNLSQLLRVRKDVLHIVSNLAMHIRLNASSSTPAQLFSLIASFLLDPADTRSPIQLYQTLLPHRRFSLTTDLALDAISRLAHLDANRAVLQRTVPPVQLRATFNALIRMLPAEANDMGLIMRSEPWMAYTERLALAVYALACSLPIPVRRLIRTQRAMGASVLRMMCRMAQYDPTTGGEKGGWSQRSPFSCLVRRVIEALRMIDEEEGSAEVIGWPVRGAKVEGDKGAGWLAGVGAEDALIMMVIEGMDPVTFEDLDVLTRVGEVAA